MPLGTWGLLYVPFADLDSTTDEKGVTRYSVPDFLTQMTPSDVVELAPDEPTEPWANP